MTRRIFLYLYTISLIFMSMTISQAHARKAKIKPLFGPVEAQVLRVIDGDTFEARINIWIDQNVIIRVRLNGIDTPELRGKCAHEKQLAQQAKNALIELFENKKIQLYDIHPGKYSGRVIAKATNHDGTNVSEYLITQGFARYYSGKTKRKAWCEVTPK